MSALEVGDDYSASDDVLEEVASEEADREASLPAYEILTYPADYTLEVLVDKWRKKQIIIPSFQRRFVWTQAQGSKLIESFLLGLPVPAIFLYNEPSSNDLLVIDGQQRLKTIAYFFEGYFGDEDGGLRTVFRLNGLDDKSVYLNKTFAELEATNETAFRKLNDAVLRAFVIRQLNPNDDTSIYHIFERLNTGGTLLHPQEIRNCIHHGPFNDELQVLNNTPSWRKVFGRPSADKRQRDVELVLRFFALLNDASGYEKPMKDFLNKFMAKHRYPSAAEQSSFGEIFLRTSDQVRDSLGDRPFHIKAGLNAAVFDAVFVAFAKHMDVPVDIVGRYEQLIKDPSFLLWVGAGTTDKDVVSRRLAKADSVLFG